MRLDDLSLPFGSTLEEVKRVAARRANIPEKKVRTFYVLRKSLDARKKSAIREVYGVLISDAEERLPEITVPFVGEKESRPVVIGFGPAGIFASYALALAGMRPIVLERGLPIEERAGKVDALWQKGVLDPIANAEYGEGTVEADIRDQYYNMREKIEPVMHIIDLAKEAMKAVGVTPIVKPIRGGTDGARLSFEGLPCPNIFAGGENFHSRSEYIPIKSLEAARDVILEIVKKVK